MSEQSKPLEGATKENPFSRTLDDYLKNLAGCLGGQEASRDLRRKALELIDRNNAVADLIESDAYRAIAREEASLRGDVKLGLVYCIDGRIPTIVLAGRFANAWEEPAGLIGLRQTASGKTVPQSTLLAESLREVAGEQRELLEIFFAHTSRENKLNTCGYMKKLQDDNKIARGVDLTNENIRLLEQDQIPAVTEFYNRVRQQLNKRPLKRVAISAVYETDTMGIVLNYGQGNRLSTTELINRMKTDLEYLVGEQLGSFGSMREKFTETKNFIDFYQRVLSLTKLLLEEDKFSHELDAYLQKNYSDLTNKQKQALRFILARTMAAQYFTGLSDVPAAGADHPFSRHGEEFLALSLAGKTVGRFDPKEQVFGSSPSDTVSAIADIKVKLAIMDSHGGRKPQILFVSNPVGKDDWNRYVNGGSESIMRIRGFNAGLFHTIISDNDLKQRVEEGNLMIVPVLVDQDTGKVLSILDHSAYI